jgi:excisionase family DNA binding protein
MTNDFESAFRHLLKTLVQEVTQELGREWRISDRTPVSQVARSEDGLLLRSREAAKRMSISERTLFKLTRSGSLPCVRIGQCVRYSVETIQKWIRETESNNLPQPISVTAILPGADSATVPRATPQPASTLVARRRPTRKTKTSASEPRRKQNAPVVRAIEKKTEDEERRNPFSDLLIEIEVDRSQLPKITNGDLMRIAEVDIATCHGWLYLNRELPDAALNKLRKHFIAFRRDDQRPKDTEADRK